MYLGVGNEKLGSDFRKTRNFAGYCRNMVEFLCVRVPRLDATAIGNGIFPGITVTLLDGGQTAHFAFMPPLDIHKKPDVMCTI
ncbi:hypothetical protein TNCV_2976571 [Trichonephila clavipes]|nr:hypothetical protein TNCV_2976571 [Trichonephila clavipes]